LKIILAQKTNGGQNTRKVEKGKKVLLPAKQEKPLNRENRKYTTIAKHISLILPVEI